MKAKMYDGKKKKDKVRKDVIIESTPEIKSEEVVLDSKKPFNLWIFLGLKKMD